MKRSLNTLFSFCLVLVLSVSILATGLIQPSPVKALSGSEFNASRIIDDFTFYSSQPTMSINEVQAFLNSKVPVCDTWGTQPYAGTTRAAYSASKGVSTPFTCLKDYRENTNGRAVEPGLCFGWGGGNLSSAEIIHYVSLTCQINTKALLVLLQKEQALVADDWPWPVQYRSAMGYGCPDTAACETQYYGFFNQVYNAARQLKKYRLNPNSFNFAINRRSFVSYQANAPQCGGSYITMQSAATAALYNYTPYQPNAAALNNLYGTGDSCSAYGNRNFWRLYREWFGSTYANDSDISHPSGTLVSIGSYIYLIENNTKRYISNASIFQSYGYSWYSVKVGTTGDMYLPDGPAIDTLAPGTIFRTTNSPVYVIDYENGSLVKQQVSLASFNALGYKWEEITVIPPNEVPLATATEILFGDLHPSGSLVLNGSQGKIYYVSQGQLRHIVNPTAFESNHFLWNKVKIATASDVSLPVSAASIDIAPGTMILGDDGIYTIEYDVSGILKRPVGPWECYADRMHYSVQDWYRVPNNSLPNRTGPIFTC